MLASTTKTSRALSLDRRQVMYLGSLAVAVSALPGSSKSAQSCEKFVVGTWGGDYEKAVQATIGNPVKSSMGAEFIADVGAAGGRKARLLAERERPTGSNDVVFLDSLDMHQVASQGLLYDLKADDIPNLANVLPQFARPYAVPQAYSAKVIVYNPDKMPTPRSFRDLWSSACAGKVGIADLLALSAIESAAMIAGGSATNYEPGKAKLLELKALGVKIYPSNEMLAMALASGEVWATIMWRARARQWQKAGLPVASVVPEEGATPITFEIAAPRNASNKACAMAFLNQALEPASQAEFAVRMGYCPTIANVNLPPDVASQVGFTADEVANFFRQDFDYLQLNQYQLLDWWTRVFKA